jgi:O-antigen/teichoic acid export membrane protein
MDDDVAGAQAGMNSTIPVVPRTGVASSSLLFLTSTVVASAGYFAATLILARQLGPGGRGTVAFATLSILAISRLARLGVPEAATVQAASSIAGRPVLLANQLVFAVFASALISAVLASFLFLFDLHPAGVTAGMIWTVCLGAILNAVVETLGAFLVGCGRRRIYALLGPLLGVGWPVGVVALWVTGQLGTTQSVLAFDAPLVVAVSVGLGAALSQGGIGRPHVGELRASLRLGFPAWVGSLAMFFNYRLDQFLLGVISSAAQLGVYSVAVNVSEVLLYAGNAAAVAVTPAVARSVPAVGAAMALRVTRGLAAVTVAATVVAIAVGPFVIPTVYGNRYRDALTPYVILAAGSVGWTISVILSGALLGARASRLSSFGSVAALGVSLVLDVALIPTYGATGAAIATTAGFAAAGATAGFAFLRRSGAPISELIPGPDDVRTLAGLVRSFRTDVRGVPAGEERP